MSSHPLPREKALLQGVSSLSTEELLAVILGTGGGGRSVWQVSRELAGILRYEPEPTIARLAQVRGVGMARAVMVVAALQIPNSLEGTRASPVLSEEIIMALTQDCAESDQESVVVITLTSRGTVRERVTISVGTLDMSIIHPRDVFRPALFGGSAALFLVHTHPSGDPQPSQADLEVTKALVGVGRIMAIPVIDHVIRTRTASFSIKSHFPKVFF